MARLIYVESGKRRAQKGDGVEEKKHAARVSDGRYQPAISKKRKVINISGAGLPAVSKWGSFLEGI